MVVIRGANDDRFDILLVQQAAPVGIGLRLREDLEGFFGTEIVDIQSATTFSFRITL